MVLLAGGVWRRLAEKEKKLSAFSYRPSAHAGADGRRCGARGLCALA
jgi:hypothetical protein